MRVCECVLVDEGMCERVLVRMTSHLLKGPLDEGGKIKVKKLRDTKQNAKHDSQYCVWGGYD